MSKLCSKIKEILDTKHFSRLGELLEKRNAGTLVNMFDCNLATHCQRKLKQLESLRLIQCFGYRSCYATEIDRLKIAYTPPITVEFRGYTSLLFSSEITFHPITKYTEKPPSWDRWTLDHEIGVSVRCGLGVEEDGELKRSSKAERYK